MLEIKVKKMNNENLKPFTKAPTGKEREKQRALQRKGGIMSGISKREKMEQAAKEKIVAAETWEMLLKPIMEEKLKQRLIDMGYENPVYLHALIFGMIGKSPKNPHMADLLLTLLEQKPANKNQVDLSASPFTGIDINIKKG